MSFDITNTYLLTVGALDRTYGYVTMNLMRTKSFHNRVRRFRREKGLRQLDLARRLNVYQSEVSLIERGERVPSVLLAKRVAKVLGRTVEEVF